LFLSPLGALTLSAAKTVAYVVVAETVFDDVSVYLILEREQISSKTIWTRSLVRYERQKVFGPVWMTGF
jgi:hypothetical protein